MLSVILLSLPGVGTWGASPGSFSGTISSNVINAKLSFLNSKLNIFWRFFLLISEMVVSLMHTRLSTDCLNFLKAFSVNSFFMALTHFYEKTLQRHGKHRLRTRQFEQTPFVVATKLFFPLSLTKRLNKLECFCLWQAFILCINFFG